MTERKCSTFVRGGNVSLYPSDSGKSSTKDNEKKIPITEVEENDQGVGGFSRQPGERAFF